MQDHEGYLWFGTRDGLNRYDGYTFTVYRPVTGDSTSLSGNIIRTLYEDRDGTLWVGTGNGGLNRFNRRTETFTPYRHDPNDASSLSHDDVRTITQTADGALWEAPGAAASTGWIRAPALSPDTGTTHRIPRAFQVMLSPPYTRTETAPSGSAPTITGRGDYESWIRQRASSIAL